MMENTIQQESLLLLKNWEKRIDLVLSQKLNDSKITSDRLQEAVEYSMLDNDREKLKGLLVYATGHLLNASDQLLDIPACAIEAIQSSTLVQDELFAMKDDLKKGKKACHRQFNEATAILTVEALRMFAFEQLTNALQPSDQKLAMIRVLAEDSGSEDIVGGSCVELEIKGTSKSVEKPEQLHWLKCGKLIRTSVMIGAYATIMPSPKIISKLETYAYGLGIGYQIINKLVNSRIIFQPEDGSALDLKQINVEKKVYVTKFTKVESKRRILELFDNSIAAVGGLERSIPLVIIAKRLRKATLSAFD